MVAIKESEAMTHHPLAQGRGDQKLELVGKDTAEVDRVPDGFPLSEVIKDLDVDGSQTDALRGGRRPYRAASRIDARYLIGARREGTSSGGGDSRGRRRSSRLASSSAKTAERAAGAGRSAQAGVPDAEPSDRGDQRPLSRLTHADQAGLARSLGSSLGATSAFGSRGSVMNALLVACGCHVASCWA